MGVCFINPWNVAERILLPQDLAATNGMGSNDRCGHHAPCHGTRPTRPDEPGDGRLEMKNQDGQVAHGTIVTANEIRKMPRN
jgi:hypothetical protein